MSNSHNRKNQPPTARGKEQSPNVGSAQELDKRSEVLQAERNHPEMNFEANGENQDHVQDMDVPQKRERAGRSRLQNHFKNHFTG